MPEARSRARFVAPRLVHRGVVEAQGLVFDERLSGERAVRARVLSLWEPGAVLRRLPDGRWWLRLSTPRRVRAAEAPGAPLVLEQGVLCAAPGLGAAARGEGAVEGSLALLRGGELEVVSPQAGEMVDPSGWLDLDAFERMLVRGPAVEGRGATVAVALAAPRESVREVLGSKVPPRSPDADKVLAALMARTKEEASASEKNRVERVVPPMARPDAQVVRWLASMFQLLASILTRTVVSQGGSSLGRAASSAATGASGRKESDRLAIQPAKPAGPDWASRVATRLNDLAARLLMASGMAARAGRKQADYLDRMMEMFEQGKLDDALRHAIPLGGGGSEQASFTLGTPQPRSDLTLSLGGGGGGAGSSILPFHGLHEQLKRLYRQAFERLDAEGQFEQAAFVLAELLRESEEAVAYLERHDLPRLAAELAEARELAPELVVRQWFVAGEVGRAVLLARRHQAFSAAVVRLEKDGSGRGNSLRMLWADTMASAGDFLGADTIASVVPGTEVLRLRWLELARSQGGTAAYEAWVRLLTLAPERLEEAGRELAPLWTDTSIEGAADRVALGTALGGLPAQLRSRPALRALARPLLRALLRDLDGLDSPLLVQLRDHFADPVLRLDWPSARGVAPAVASTSLQLVVPESSAGTVPVMDAAVLPGGRWLVALGESGAVLLTREGKRVHHFEQAAFRLVLSEQGDRALALAPRGRFTRVSRLDLGARREQIWTEAELSAWASDFDGASWIVGSRGSLVEVDALDGGWKALWQLRGVGPVLAVARLHDPQGAPMPSAVTRGPEGELFWWRFSASDRALRHRDVVLPPVKRDAPPALIGLLPSGVVRWEQGGTLTRLASGSSVLEAAGPSRPWRAGGEAEDQEASRKEVPLAWRRTPALVAVKDQMVVGVDGRLESLTWGSPSTLTLAVSLEGAGRVGVHPSPFGLALFDDRGRLLHVALEGGPRVMRQIRL